MQWLNYHHLYYFWSVAHEGSVTAAAAKLQLSRPTVTGQLRRLERSFGNKLFRQSGRRLLLTAFGETVLAYADEVRDHYGSVHQIYNNAGVAFFGEIENSEFGDFERVMNVNYWGVVNGTKAFLPHVIASGAGHIVNVSSIWGIFAVPGQSAYNSSKFAVRGFTEALRQEMTLAHHPVGVTVVYPSGVRTAIARTATGAQGLDVKELADLFDNKLAKGSPEAAARTILKGVRKNKAKVLVGPGARMFDVVVRATGSGYERIFGPLTGRMMPKMDTKV